MSKAAKKRECPAVGHSISAAECGANRISHYACPAQCGWLPFAPANYLQLLELEEKLDKQCMDFVLADAPDQAAKELELLRVRHDPNFHALHAWFVRNLFYDRAPDGRTCSERLEQSAALGLKNDERVLLRAKSQTRVALVEIHQVIDDQCMEAVDLFSPDAPPLRFQDRRLAATAARFATALAWIYPLPHYWRLSGSAIVIPELAQFDPREIVTEIVKHLGGPVTEKEMRAWLAEHFTRFDEALMAVCRARRMEMFAGMDAKLGKAVYELRSAFAECRKQLDEIRDVEPETLAPEEREEGFAEARVWFAETPEFKQSAVAGGRVALGRVLLGQAHWRLEAFGAERLAQLRRKFEAQLRKFVRFTGERLDDFAGSMAAKEPPFEKSLIPPRLLEDPQRFHFSTSRMPAPAPGISLGETEVEVRDAMDRAFLDDNVPALDGHTPREAARDPALRPKLIRLLKQRVRFTDEDNLKTGGNRDINSMLRELGADEIIFNPPPRRAALRSPQVDDADVVDEFLEDPMVDPSLPPAPRLPDEPLSHEEVERRVQTILNKFRSPIDAEEAMLASGLTLLEDADEVSLNNLTDEEFDIARVLILQAAMVLIPTRHRAPAINRLLLERVFEQNLERMTQALQSGVSDVLQFIKESPQPELMDLMATEVIQLCKAAPEAAPVSLEAQPVIIALIKSAVEVLDYALRK